MKRVRPTAVRVAHAVALAASVAALAFALALRPTGLVGVLLSVLALATLLTPFVEWVSVPPFLVARLPRILVRLLLLSAFLAWLTRSMGMLVLDPGIVPLVTAALLVPMALVFAVAPRAFPPGRTLVPATIFVLGLAGLDPAPRGYGASALFFVRDADHNAFAERYLPLAVVALLALWTGALAGEGPRWRLRHAIGLAVSVLLAVALAATGIVGLPLLQPRVERAFAAALDQGQTGLSGESTLGEFGALASSRRRVLDLWSSPASAAWWRLPSEVFTRFDGRRWSNAAPRATSQNRKEAVRPPVLRPTTPPNGVDELVDGLGSWFLAPPADARSSIALRVDQAEVGRWPLLLPRGTIAVTAETPYLERDRFGLLRRVPGLSLTVYGALMPAGPTQPAERAPELTDDEREEALTPPPHLDPRVGALARRLALQGADPREKIRATVRHLQGGYRYTLAPGAFRSGDPLAEFLFEKKAGYCEYFASAAVVLLRLEGVPARFVKGLSAGPDTDVGGGLRVVRESDAHAWIEAWVPGEGWVEEDPTPPGQLAGARPPGGTLDRLFQRARAELAAAWNRLSARGPGAFFVWLGRQVALLARRALRQPVAWLSVLLLALGPRLLRLWRERRRRLREAAREGAAVPADLRALLREVEHRWAAAGHPRPTARGLLEHARALASVEATGPALPAPLRAVGREAVEAYYRARFGGEPPEPSETNRLRQALRA